MEQHFIDGDSLSFKDYLWNLIHPVRFHKIGKLFVFSTLKTICYCIPFMLFMLLCAYFSGSTAKEEPRQIVWFFSVLLLFCLLAVWAVSLHHSFIAPVTIKRKVTRFVRECIPDATNLTRYDTDTWRFEWKGQTFFICYRNYQEIGRKAERYFKIVTASCVAMLDYRGTPDQEEYLQDGLSVLLWDCTEDEDTKKDIEGFACVQYKTKFFPEEITEALETLLKYEKAE